MGLLHALANVSPAIRSQSLILISCPKVQCDRRSRESTREIHCGVQRFVAPILKNTSNWTPSQVKLLLNEQSFLKPRRSLPTFTLMLQQRVKPVCPKISTQISTLHASSKPPKPVPEGQKPQRRPCGWLNWMADVRVLSIEEYALIYFGCVMSTNIFRPVVTVLSSGCCQDCQRRIRFSSFKHAF